MVQTSFSAQTVEERILDEIRKEVPREKYGHKEIIWEPIYFDMRHSCLAVWKKRGDFQNGYDCIDASLKVKSILEKNGRKSHMAEGRSEDAIFYSNTAHKFVISDDIIVDATPFYPLLGAKHIVKGEFSDEDLQRIANIVNLKNFVLDFQECGNCKYLMTAAFKGTYSDTNKVTKGVRIDVIRKRETPEEACKIMAFTDENKIRELLKNGLEPITRDYSVEEAEKRLKTLEVKGAIRIERIGLNLSLEGIGNLEKRIKGYDNVSEDLKKLLSEYTKEFVHLIESASLI